MAQDRMYLKCRHCGDVRSIFKIIAGGESPEMLTEHDDEYNRGLRAWMGIHIAHNPLSGEWLFDFGDAAQWFVLETETAPAPLRHLDMRPGRVRREDDALWREQERVERGRP